MAIGRYFTDAINQSITNERMSMRDRFSQELQQRRYDEANAYRDKSFMENVRQFQLGHALRQAADKRAGEAHKFLYDPKTGYMHQKKAQEAEAHGWAGDRQKMTSEAHDWARNRHEDAQEAHDFLYSEDDGYMRKKMGWEEKQQNFLYGEDGLKVLEKNLLEKKIDSYGQPEPMTEFQKQYLGPYYKALAEAAKMRGMSGSGDDKSLLGTPGTSVSMTENLLNREMFRYAQELNEMLEHEDSNWWDFGKVAASTGVGAGLGTIIPGIGNLLGAGIGGGVGLLSSLLFWTNDPLMSKDEALTTFSQVGSRIRAQLKREHPNATEAEINKRMIANWNTILNARQGTGADADTTVGDRIRAKIGRMGRGGMDSIYTEEALRRAFINGAVPNTQQTAPTDIEEGVRQQWNKTHLPPDNPLQIINRPKMR